MSNQTKNRKNGKPNSGRSKPYPNNNGKGRNMSRDNTKERVTPASIEDNEVGNHISWYVPDPNMLKDVASIPFNFRVGDRLPIAMGQAVSGNTAFSQYEWVEPGIFSVRFLPTYGDLIDAQSAGNVASTAVYSWVRHANSGSRNYDSVDLMLYLLAMDSIYMGITWCQRLLANTMAYSRVNIYPPAGLIKAMGVQWSDALVGDLPAMRHRLNQMILKATTLAVPRALPIYERHAFMCANIYADNTEERTQFYIFNPDYLWQFGLDGEGKGMLSPVKFCAAGLPSSNGKSQLNGGVTWQTMFGVVESLINALYGDEFAGIKSGDITKAYGRDQLFELATIPDNIIADPLYDGEFLEQIHNAFAVGQVKQSATSIKQVIPDPTVSNPYLVANYGIDIIGSTGVMIPLDHAFDLHMDISPENVMRASRLSGPTVINSDNTVVGVGTEIVTTLGVVEFDYAAGDFVMYTSNSVPNVAPFNDGAWAVSDGLMRFMLKSQSFFRSPIIYPVIGMAITSVSTRDFAFPIGETSKVTVLSATNRKQLNEVAMLGCFNVPRLTLGFIENS